MPETETVPTAVLGQPGERCVECETPLAVDQRYCLSCGRRRGPLRVPFREHLAEVEAAPPPPAPPPDEPPRWSRFGAPAAAAGAALLLLALGVGAVLGHAVSKTPKAARPAAAPVIRVNVPPATVVAGPPSATPAATFTSDWPDGQSGWTVQLQTLGKASSNPAAVTAAKTQATGQGATAVGALDSDNFSSLDPGQYVIYSGVFPSKGKATSALKGLKKKFPGAKVVQVKGGGSTGSSVNGAPKRGVSPSQYEKQSKKVKKPISTGGTAPPKDNKKPGGGSKVTTIG